MPQKDYEAGREVGRAEGRRQALQSRRVTDIVIMALVAAAVVIITQVQQHSTERLIHETDQKTAETGRNAFEGCELRNKIVERQVTFYETMAQIEKGNRFIDDLIRKQRVDEYMGTADDIGRIGVRDCSVYLKVVPTPTPSPK